MKHLSLILLTFFLTACQQHDAHFYRTNPIALQKAFMQCPKESPGQLNCDEIASIVNEVNQLARELQQGPQEFGQKIMSLQNQLAKMEAKSDNSNAKNEINALKERLAMHLAIVKWLESPEA